MDKEPTYKYHTPEQIAEKQREADEMVKELSEKLSPEEVDAWMDAYQEDLQRNIDELEYQAEWATEVLEILRAYGGYANAVEAIKKKSDRTRAELKFLRTFNQLKRSGLLK